MADQQANQKILPYYKRAAKRFLHGTKHRSVEAAVYAGKPLEQWLALLDFERQADRDVILERYATGTGVGSGKGIRVRVLAALEPTRWQSRAELLTRLTDLSLQQIVNAIAALNARGQLQARQRVTKRLGRTFEYILTPRGETHVKSSPEKNNPDKSSSKTDQIYPKTSQKPTETLAKTSRFNPESHHTRSARAHAPRPTRLEMRP